MLAIGLPVDQVRPLLHGDLHIDIAAINGPSSVTVAGDVGQLKSLGETLTERAVFNRMLHVEVPYHSRRMDPILPELRSALADLAPRKPQVALYSSVTGEAVTDALWDADYWCANVREPVRFADVTKALLRAGHRVFVEVGPHPVLSANIREVLLTNGETGATISTLDRDRSDAESIRRTIAGLYTAGALDVLGDLRGNFCASRATRYPWQRQRLHQEVPEQHQFMFGTPNSYSMLGDADFNVRSGWELRVSGQALPWLGDHVVDGHCMLPGAAYLDAPLSGISMHTGVASVAAEDVRFVAPLVVDPANATILRTELNEASRRFTIRSRSATSTVRPCMRPGEWSRKSTWSPSIPCPMSAI